MEVSSGSQVTWSSDEVREVGGLKRGALIGLTCAVMKTERCEVLREALS